MSLEETLRDLKTVLNADIFISDDEGLGTKSLPLGKEKVEQMRKLLRRDKEKIRQEHDVMNIRYKKELVGWLTQAGNYLNGREMEVPRFNSSYENMLAYYAGRVLDKANGTGAMPTEVLVAQQRFVKYRERMERRMAR